MRITVRGADGSRHELAEGAARLSALFRDLHAKELNKLAWMEEEEPAMEISLRDVGVATRDVLGPLVGALNAYADAPLPDTLVDGDRRLALPAHVMRKLRPLAESEDLAVRAMLVAKAVGSAFLEMVVGALLAAQFTRMSEEEQRERLARQ